MSLFGECTIKNITAEYVEEQLALKEAADISVVDDIELSEDITEAAYIDALLEALED